MSEGEWGIGFRSGDGDWWFLATSSSFGAPVTTRNPVNIRWYTAKDETEKEALKLGQQWWAMGRDAINKMLMERFFGEPSDSA